MTFNDWLSEEEFDGFLAGMLSADYVAIDTEASGHDIRDGQGYCMGVSVSYYAQPGARAASQYFPFRHRNGYNYSKESLQRFTFVVERLKCAVFHNAKFDLVSLRTLGIEYVGKFYDTMLMAHMVNENWASKALDWLGRTLLNDGKVRGADFQAWLKAFGWENIPSEIMWEYASHDTELTLNLFNYLWPDFDAQDFNGSLWDRRQNFVRLIADMESPGIRIDQGLCHEQAAIGRTRMELIAAELGFNPGSPKQLGEFLLGDLGLPVFAWTQPDKQGNKTDKSKPSFDKAAMEKYDELLEELDNPAAKKVVEYRGWQKAVAVAYEGYPALVSPDGRLRPNYKLHGTVTGRLSCEKPNLQQIPRVSTKPWDGSLKSVFIPADGYQLWEADYSQLEFRLGAAYAKERGLLEEFSKPDSDVFTRMASELGFTRQDTKTLTYTLQYGGGINRLSQVFKVNESRAAEIRDTYFQTYPGFKTMTQKAAAVAKRRGYVKTWSGRRRHFQWPDSEAHKAFNAIIQGGAADIVETTMLRMRSEVANNPDCKMLLQVHDSIVFEIKEDKLDEYLPRIKHCMENVQPEFGVYFAADVHEWGK